MTPSHACTWATCLSWILVRCRFRRSCSLLTIESGAGQLLWKPVQAGGPAPLPRSGHVMASVGGRLLVFGGVVRTHSAAVAMNDVHCYDPGASTSALLARTPD
jgi:hypothetical protein